MMFACWDSIEPVRYVVCDTFIGCGGWFVVVVPHLLVGLQLHCLRYQCVL